MLKVLNLYAGIGGNRKLWQNVEVTAVEYEPKIAAIYKDFFPNDIVIIDDAHQYLLDHYKEFDFIWSSPPCYTHSGTNNFLNAQGVIRYPDMTLYQQIIFLSQFFEGKYCIENVIPYYEPLIKPQIIDRHCFWANFKIKGVKVIGHIGKMGKNEKLKVKDKQEILGIDISNAKLGCGIDKYKVLNNCCHPEIGLSILNSALNIITERNIKPGKLF